MSQNYIKYNMRTCKHILNTTWCHLVFIYTATPKTKSSSGNLITYGRQLIMYVTWLMGFYLSKHYIRYRIAKQVIRIIKLSLLYSLEDKNVTQVRKAV